MKIKCLNVRNPRVKELLQLVPNEAVLADILERTGDNASALEVQDEYTKLINGTSKGYAQEDTKQVIPEEHKPEINPKISELFKEDKTDSKTILQKIAKGDSNMAPIARLLLKFDINVPIEVIHSISSDNPQFGPLFVNNSYFASKERKTAAGVFMHGDGKVYISKTGRLGETSAEALVIHEILHGLTAYHLVGAQTQLTQNFDKLRQHLLDSPIAAQFEYQLSDNDEFLTAIFTNAKFMRALQEMPATKPTFKNFWEELAKYFKVLLSKDGNNIPQSMFDQAFSNAAAIVEEAEAYRQGSNAEQRYYNEMFKNQGNGNFQPDAGPTSVQKIIYDKLSILDKKSSIADDEYVVQGHEDVKWTRASAAAKQKIENKTSFKTADEQAWQDLLMASGNLGHQMQANIIKKYFPEFNTHFEEAPVDESLEEFQAALEQYLLPFIEQAKGRGSVMVAEIFVANLATKKAGTIDLLEITPEGNYYVYDLKTRYTSEKTGFRRYNKVDEWSLQTKEYNKLLEEGDNILGVPRGKMLGTYVLELTVEPKDKNVDLKTKTTYVGSKATDAVKFLSKNGANNFKVVAPFFLRTGEKKLDSLIERLLIQIRAIHKKKALTEVEKESKNALLLSKMELLQELQLKKDAKLIVKHAKQELFEIEQLLNNNNLNSKIVLPQLELYSRLSSYIDGELTEAERKELREIQGYAVELKTRFENQAKDNFEEAATSTGVMAILQDFGKDLFAAVKDIAWFRQMSLGISNIDNPIVQTAYRAYTIAMQKSRNSLQTLTDALKHKTEAYVKYMGSNDFSILIDGDNMVSEWRKEFYAEMEQARKSKDQDWLDKNVTYNKEEYLKKRDFQLDFMESYRKNNLNKLKLENPEATEEELVVALAEQEKHTMDEWDKTNLNNAYLYYTPKDQWKSQKYLDIRGKYKGTPVEEFYDLFRATIEEANRIFPEHIKKNFIPNFTQSFTQMSAEKGLIGAIKYNWGDLLNNLDVKYDEQLYGNIDPYSGQVTNNLSVPGLNSIKGKSKDLPVVLFRFMEGVYRYQELVEVEETLLTAQRTLRNSPSKVTDAIGKELPEDRIPDKVTVKNRTADAFDEWIESSLYNKKRKQEGGIEYTITGFEAAMGLGKKGDKRKLELARMFDGLLKYVSLRNLGLNMYSPVVNWFGGEMNMFMTGADGRDYNVDDLTWASAKVMQGKTGLLDEDAKKAKLIYEYFGIEQSDISRDIALELSGDKLTKLANDYNAMSLIKESENVLQRTGLIAMIKSGKHSYTWDSFSVVDGKLVVSDDAPKKALFRNKVIRVNQNNMGGVNPEDMAMAKRTIAGRMLMQHRNWLPALAIHRFGSRQYDWVLERDVEGRYVTAVRVLAGYFTKGLSQTLTPEEKAVMRAAGTEAGLILAVGCMLLAMGGVDDDEKKKAWYVVSHKLNKRIFGELFFFIDPTLSNQFQILLSPAASISTIEEGGKFALSIWKEATETDPKKLKRNKPTEKFIKMVPVWNKVDTFLEDLGLNED